MCDHELIRESYQRVCSVGDVEITVEIARDDWKTQFKKEFTYTCYGVKYLKDDRLIRFTRKNEMLCYNEVYTRTDIREDWDGNGKKHSFGEWINSICVKEYRKVPKGDTWTQYQRKVFTLDEFTEINLLLNDKEFQESIGDIKPVDDDTKIHMIRCLLGLPSRDKFLKRHFPNKPRAYKDFKRRLNDYLGAYETKINNIFTADDQEKIIEIVDEAKSLLKGKWNKYVVLRDYIEIVHLMNENEPYTLLRLLLAQFDYDQNTNLIERYDDREFVEADIGFEQFLSTLIYLPQDKFDFVYEGVVDIMKWVKINSMLYFTHDELNGIAEISKVYSDFDKNSWRMTVFDFVNSLDKSVIMKYIFPHVKREETIVIDNIVSKMTSAVSEWKQGTETKVFYNWAVEEIELRSMLRDIFRKVLLGNHPAYEYWVDFVEREGESRVKKEPKKEPRGEIQVTPPPSPPPPPPKLNPVSKFNPPPSSSPPPPPPPNLKSVSKLNPHPPPPHPPHPPPPPPSSFQPPPSSFRPPPLPKLNPVSKFNPPPSSFQPPPPPPPNLKSVSKLNPHPPPPSSFQPLPLSKLNPHPPPPSSFQPLPLSKLNPVSSFQPPPSSFQPPLFSNIPPILDSGNKSTPFMHSGPSEDVDTGDIERRRQIFYESHLYSAKHNYIDIAVVEINKYIDDVNAFAQRIREAHGNAADRLIEGLISTGRRGEDEILGLKHEFEQMKMWLDFLIGEINSPNQTLSKINESFDNWKLVQTEIERLNNKARRLIGTYIFIEPTFADIESSTKVKRRTKNVPIVENRETLIQSVKDGKEKVLSDIRELENHHDTVVKPLIGKNGKMMDDVRTLRDYVKHNFKMTGDDMNTYFREVDEYETQYGKALILLAGSNAAVRASMELMESYYTMILSDDPSHNIAGLYEKYNKCIKDIASEYNKMETIFGTTIAKPNTLFLKQKGVMFTEKVNEKISEIDNEMANVTSSFGDLELAITNKRNEVDKEVKRVEEEMEYTRRSYKMNADLTTYVDHISKYMEYAANVKKSQDVTRSKLMNKYNRIHAMRNRFLEYMPDKEGSIEEESELIIRSWNEFMKEFVRGREDVKNEKIIPFAPENALRLKLVPGENYKDKPLSEAETLKRDIRNMFLGCKQEYERVEKGSFLKFRRNLARVLQIVNLYIYRVRQADNSKPHKVYVLTALYKQRDTYQRIESVFVVKLEEIGKKIDDNIAILEYQRGVELLKQYKKAMETESAQTSREIVKLNNLIESSHVYHENVNHIAEFVNAKDFTVDDPKPAALELAKSVLKQGENAMNILTGFQNAFGLDEEMFARYASMAMNAITSRLPKLTGPMIPLLTNPATQQGTSG